MWTTPGLKKHQGQQQQNYRYSSPKNLIEMLLKLLIGEIDAKLLKTAKIHPKKKKNEDERR